MSILGLRSRQFAVIKAFDPLPYQDIAYRLNTSIASFCLTPYKLREMYSLKLRYSNNEELQTITTAVNRSPTLYVTDLGNVSTIGRTIESLRTYVRSQTYTNEVRTALEEALNGQTEENVRRRRTDTSWYGYPTPEYSDYILSVKRVYPKLAEANEFFDRFESELRINPETDVPKPRTLFTARPTGVFTFSRIAPTLYAYPCYKVQETDDKCLPPTQIEKRDERFYLSSAPDVEVKRYGNEVREDGTVRARTQTKKVYATKQNKIKVTPYINIYVNVVASAFVDAEEYRYNSFAAIALAKLLITNGFKVSITSIFLGRTNCITGVHNYPYDAKDPLKLRMEEGVQRGGDMLFLHKFMVKSYDELLDFNTALIYGGDPAFFRWDMFQAHIYSCFAWHRAIPDSLGAPIDDESTVDDILLRYNINNLENETRVVISGRFSENSAADAVRTKLSELRLLYGGLQ